MKKLRLIPILLALTLSGCIAPSTPDDSKPSGGDQQEPSGEDTPPVANEYTVTFNSDGGTSVSSQTVKEGGTATKPTDPTKEGSTFAGWFLGEQEFNFSSQITSNITLVAHWTAIPAVNEYTVTFNSDGGSSVTSQTIEEGETATKPTDPTKDGFEFDGWYLNDVVFDFSTKINANITLVAHWIENIVDYISKVKLNANSDFSTYENKTFVNDKISSVTLKSVLDGDTIHVYEGSEAIKMRLAYLDCPETSEEYGTEATQFTKDKLQNAKTVVITNATLSSTGEATKDSTGDRYLGFVWYSPKANAGLNELRCLNLEIILEGFALMHNGGTDPLHGYFQYCLSSAQTAKKNIWKDYIAPEGDYGYDHYDGYYGALTWENGEDLKQKLYQIISKDVNKLDYTWEANQKADHSLYDLEMLDVVYSDKDVYFSKTQTYWQREHVFCASLMTGKQTSQATGTLGRATDYHNLFAGESSGNSSRGNKNYGQADKTHASYTDRGVSTGGYSFDPKNFEPGEVDKGRLARSIFYMDVMYSVTENPAYQPLSVVEEYVTYDASDCKFAIGNKTDLLSWCTKSVDLLEMQHNELVYSTKINGVAQNNRNPFVDYPGLIDYVYGAKKDSAGDLKNLVPRAFDLGLENEGIQYYAIKTAKREAAVGSTYTKSDFTIVGIDNKFQEVPVDQSIATFSNVQLNEMGTKQLTINTDINTIKFDIEVKQAEVDYSYKYEFSGDVKADFGTNHIGSDGNGGTITPTLADKKWNVTAAHETDMRKGSNDIGAQFGFATATRPGTITFETVDAMTNVNAIKLVANTNASQTMNVKIYVGETEVSSYSLTGNSKESYEKIMELSSNLSGKVKIVLTPVGSYSVVVKSIAINEVK